MFVKNCFCFVLMSISFFETRIGAMPFSEFHKVQQSSSRGNTNKQTSRDIIRPELLDRAGLYIIFIMGGIGLTVLSGYFYLLLALMIDSLVEKDIGVADERVKRGNIPKIIFDRVVKAEDMESDEDSMDDDTTTITAEVVDVHHAHSGVFSQSQTNVHNHETGKNKQQSDKEVEQPEMKEPEKKPQPEKPEPTKEDYVKWIKTIYFLFQISQAMQAYIGKKSKYASDRQSKPESRLVEYKTSLT